MINRITDIEKANKFDEKTYLRTNCYEFQFILNKNQNRKINNILQCIKKIKICLHSNKNKENLNDLNGAPTKNQV